jgi:hypothetical protein
VSVFFFIEEIRASYHVLVKCSDVSSCSARTVSRGRGHSHVQHFCIPDETLKKELIGYVDLRSVGRRYDNYNVYNSVSDLVTGIALQVAYL